MRSGTLRSRINRDPRPAGPVGRRRHLAKALALAGENGGQADAAALRLNRSHQLPDCGKDGGDSFVVLDEPLAQTCFELFETAHELTVGAEQLAQLHECAYHVDADLDGPRTIEDSGCLDRSVLRESKRELRPTAPT